MLDDGREIVYDDVIDEMEITTMTSNPVRFYEHKAEYWNASGAGEFHEFTTTEMWQADSAEAAIRRERDIATASEPLIPARLRLAHLNKGRQS